MQLQGFPRRDPKKYFIQVVISILPDDWFDETEGEFDLNDFLKNEQAEKTAIEELYLTFFTATNTYSLIGGAGPIATGLYDAIVSFMEEQYGSRWGNLVQ